MYTALLAKDIGVHGTNLEILQKKKKSLEGIICQKKKELKDIDDHVNQIQTLSKTLRVLGRQKVKVKEEVKWTNHHLDWLTVLLKDRPYPDLKQKRATDEKKETKIHR